MAMFCLHARLVFHMSAIAAFLKHFELMQFLYAF